MNLTNIQKIILGVFAGLALSLLGLSAYQSSQQKFGGFPVFPSNTSVTSTLSQFPASGTLTQGSTTPNTTKVGSNTLFFNGSTWDFAQSSSTSVTQSARGFLNNLPFGQFLNVPLTMTVTSTAPLQMMADGSIKVTEQQAPAYEDNTNAVAGVMVKPLAVSAYSYSAYQNNSFTTSNVKAASGNLYSLHCINSATSTLFAQIHNTASTPSPGATATFKFIVPASGATEIGTEFFGPGGMNLASGIAIAQSAATSTYSVYSQPSLACDIGYK